MKFEVEKLICLDEKRGRSESSELISKEENSVFQILYLIKTFFNIHYSTPCIQLHGKNHSSNTFILEDRTVTFIFQLWFQFSNHLQIQFHVFWLKIHQNRLITFQNIKRRKDTYQTLRIFRFVRVSLIFSVT